jgi:hypothetical protein
VSYRDRADVENESGGFIAGPPSPQDRQNAIDRYLQFAKGWNNDLTLQRRTFSEDYRRGELAYFYDVELLSSFVAQDERAAAKDISGLYSVSFARLVLCPESVKFSNLKLWDHEPMFISDIELVQVEKGITVPSLVRLYDVEQGTTDLDDGLLLFSLSEKLFKILPRRIDGKLAVFAGEVNRGNRIPNIVESRFQVMHGVPQNEPKLIREGFLQADLNKIFSSMRVFSDGDEIHTTFLTESLSHSLQVRDVMVGPFEL